MRISLRVAAVALGLATLAPAVASAQAVDGYGSSYNPTWNSAPSNQRVDAQQYNQQQRIRQGVESGELTRGEARGLERGQRQVNRMQNRAEADGVVTPRERSRIAQANRNNSRNIYEQKHDRQEAPSFGIHSW